MELVHEAGENLVLLLAPFVPHIAEELWQELGHTQSVHKESWPAYSPEALIKDTVEIVVQINGKIKARLDVPANATQAELIAIAEQHPAFPEWTGGKAVVKQVAIPGKLVNLVVK